MTSLGEFQQGSDEQETEGWGRSGGAGHVPFPDLGVGFVKSMEFLKIHQTQHWESVLFSARTFNGNKTSLLKGSGKLHFSPKCNTPPPPRPELLPLEIPYCVLQGIVLKFQTP